MWKSQLLEQNMKNGNSCYRFCAEGTGQRVRFEKAITRNWFSVCLGHRESTVFMNLEKILFKFKWNFSKIFQGLIIFPLIHYQLW